MYKKRPRVTSETYMNGTGIDIETEAEQETENPISANEKNADV